MHFGDLDADDPVAGVQQEVGWLVVFDLTGGEVGEQAANSVQVVAFKVLLGLAGHAFIFCAPGSDIALACAPFS